MKVIGITGGVGCGKTAVLQEIQKKYNCKVLLADVVANEIKKRGQQCYQPLIDLLGEQILGSDLEIDKPKMAEAIFKNTNLLAKVNQIIHPAVKEYILSQIALENHKNQYDFLFVEAALLIEAGYQTYLDTLWYIYADYNTRVERLFAGRGYSEEKVQSIMSKQLSEEMFEQHCEVMINNSGALLDTMIQIDEVIERMIEGTVHEAL